MRKSFVPEKSKHEAKSGSFVATTLSSNAASAVKVSHIMTHETLFEAIKDVLGVPVLVTVNSPFLSQVGFFPLKPSASTCVVVTNGLAGIPLIQRGMASLRQELMVVADDSLARGEVASLLCSIAQEIAQRRHAIEHGEVFGPAGSLFPESRLTALFATRPVFLPSALAEHKAATGTTVGVWLVPISDAEAELARRVGPDRFEEYIEEVARKTSVYGFFRLPGEALA